MSDIDVRRVKEELEQISVINAKPTKEVLWHGTLFNLEVLKSLGGTINGTYPKDTSGLKLTYTIPKDITDGQTGELIVTVADYGGGAVYSENAKINITVTK